MKALRVLFILVCVSVSPTFAADLSEDETRLICDQAMAHFAKNELQLGYEVFIPYWPLPETEVKGLIEQTKTQWASSTPRFGESLGFEYIKTSKAGESFLQHVYIQKFEKHAIKWTFTFYKPHEKWIVNTLIFQQNIGSVFE